MGSKMKQDKAVTSLQPTPARNADRKWRFDAVFETFTFENGGVRYGIMESMRTSDLTSQSAGMPV